MSISLDELAGKKPENLQSVSISDMGLPKAEETTNPIENPDNFIGAAFGKLTERVAAEKKEYDKAVEEYEKKLDDQGMDEALDNFDPDADVNVAPTPQPQTETPAVLADVPTEVEPIKSNIRTEMEADDDAINAEVAATTKETSLSQEAEQKKTEAEFNNIFDNSDDISTEDKELLELLAGNDEAISDTPEESESVLTKEQENENIRLYKKQVQDAINNKRSIIDTSGFKVSRKHISMNALLQKKEPDKKIADWVLPTAGKAFSMAEFSGIDIQKLNPQRQRNRINSVKEIYRTMYNHIPGADPTAFESWLRSTPFRDQDQLYFAAYKATFGEANYVTYQCNDSKCQKIFMQEFPIESMYEIDKEYQEEFDKILNKDTTPSTEIESEIFPISDKFAIGIVEPSIYSVDIESIMIDEELQTKYARIINFLPFIDAIYYIDAEKNEFVPVDENPVPGDFAKTVKRRLAIYYNILNTLDNDEISILSAHTMNLRNKPSHIKFVIPECTCPECGRTVAKENTTAAQILFNRAQSALLANLSEN